MLQLNTGRWVMATPRELIASVGLAVALFVVCNWLNGTLL